MDEGIAIARSPMTKAIAFSKQTTLPDKLTSLDSRVQVSTSWPGSVSQQQRMDYSWSSVAPMDEAVFVIS